MGTFSHRFSVRLTTHCPVIVMTINNKNTGKCEWAVVPAVSTKRSFGSIYQWMTRQDCSLFRDCTLTAPNGEMPA